MSTIDVETLLQPVSADGPCGEDLEYDAAFGELERSAQGKEEQQIGDTIVEAEEPDWREVRKLALALFSRTKDLRVVIYLIQANLRTHGFVGFAEGLELLRDMLQQYWDCVFPELDVEDNNDPTMRINALISLCDDQLLLNPIRKTPLVSSRMMGQFSLRDIAIATGEIQPVDDSAKVEMAAIDAAFMDTELEELQATTNAVNASIDAISQIEIFVTEQVGVSNAASFIDLANLLKEVSQILQERLSRRGVGVSETGETAEVIEQGAAEVAVGASQPAASLSGEINSREDVVRALDKIQKYYASNEPTSPVPMLMERAKRLVDMDFMQIIQNIAPDGMSQVEALRGPEITQEDDY